MVARILMNARLRAANVSLIQQPFGWHLWLLIHSVILVVTQVIAAAMSLALLGAVSPQYLMTGIAIAIFLTPVSLFLVRYLLQDMIRLVKTRRMDSYKLQQAIIDAIPIRIFWKDKELRYMGCNKAFAADAGVDNPEDIVGKDDFQLGWSDQAELYRSDDRAIIESGVPRLAFDEPQKTPDGGTIWLQTSKVPLQNSDNETIGVFGIYEDITERKLIQDTLARAKEQRDQAEKLVALSRLVAGISHELNTPIGNSILTASALSDYTRKFSAEVNDGALRRSQLTRFIADAATASDILMRNLERAEVLIADFKQLAVNQTYSNRCSFELGTFVQELLAGLGPSIKKTPFFIVIDVPPNLRMDSFPGPLAQVISNFVNNSILHGFDGRQEGEMRLTASLMDTDHVRIRFSDNGVGIPASDVARVLEPFFTTKMGRGGTGLGLSIVHNIVTGPLGGTMVLASEVGKGSTFTLQLPRVAPLDKVSQEVSRLQW